MALDLTFSINWLIQLKLPSPVASLEFDFLNHISLAIVGCLTKAMSNFQFLILDSEIISNNLSDKLSCLRNGSFEVCWTELHFSITLKFTRGLGTSLDLVSEFSG